VVITPGYGPPGMPGYDPTPYELGSVVVDGIDMPDP